MSDQRYVVLKNDVVGQDWPIEFMKLCWRYEPESRYIGSPPRNTNWKLIGIFENRRAAENKITQVVIGKDNSKGTRRTTARKMGRKLSASIRFEVFRRDDYRCQICGKTSRDGVQLEIDHKHPVAHGGNNNLENLWILCKECNLGKMTKPLESKEGRK